jgi:hypothetical protein
MAIASRATASREAGTASSGYRFTEWFDAIVSRCLGGNELRGFSRSELDQIAPDLNLSPALAHECRAAEAASSLPMGPACC